MGRSQEQATLPPVAGGTGRPGRRKAAGALGWVPVAAASLSLLLWARPLWEPDEGRYAEIAREMLSLGDWIVPHLNGFPYLDKPPLGSWMTSASLRAFGRSEWAARLPCALSALLAVILTARLAEGPRGRSQTGTLAAVILASSLGFWIFAQFLALDMIFTALLTASLWLFWRGLENPPRRAALWAGAGTAAGLAVLAKGPAALVLAGLIIALSAFRLGRREILLDPRLWAAGGIALLVPLPWFVLVELREPGALSFFFLRENLLRFLTEFHGRGGSLLYYAPVLLIGLVPWIGLLPEIWRQRGGAPADELPLGRFLLIWLGTVLIFFSLSGSKLPAYVLPAFPPLAALSALALGRSGGPGVARKLTRNLGAASLLLILLAAVLAPIHFPGSSGPLLLSLLPAAVLAGLFLLQARRTPPGAEPARALLGTAALAFLFQTSLFLPARSLELFFSTRALALRLKEKLGPDDVVLSFDANLLPPERSAQEPPAPGLRERLRGRLSSFRLTEIADLFREPLDPLGIRHRYAPTYDRRLQSLPFYLDRRVVIVGRLGELEPGARRAPDPDVALSPERLSRLFRERRVYGVCKAIHFPAAASYGPVEIIDREGDLVLFRNRPPR